MAGQSMRDIKRRIQSVKSTQQITNAMEMVAAAKLRRAQQQLSAGEPFVTRLRDALGRVMEHGDVKQDLRTLHPLLELRDVAKVAYVVITADRGLAGGYNANVLRLAADTLAAEERPYSVIVVGRKGRDYFVRRDYEVYSGDMPGNYFYIGDELSFDEARVVTRFIADLYQNKTFDEIVFVHNTFVSAATHESLLTRLLPIDAEGLMGTESASEVDDDFVKPIYEPDPQTVINVLIPRYIETQVYSMMLAAKAAEQGARMLAMRNATENADEMIDELTLSFNRARQNSITTELSEIVGGADALAGAR